MTMGMADQNDTSASYWEHRQQASAEDVIARARARIKAAEPVAAPVEKAATPIKMQLGDYVAPGVVVQGIKSVGKDVLKGAVEGPRQAIGGVSDAVHNAMMGVSHLGDWVRDNVVNLDIPVPLTGSAELDQFISDPAKAMAGKKNEVDPPESVTGNLVRETSRFLTGFIPLFKAGKAAGLGSVTAGAAAGGATDAVTRDPEEDNLVNLLKQFPALQNPVSDFLQSNPDDPEAVARMKKGLEGAGLGVLADGVILGVKAIYNARRAGTSVRKVADTLAEQKAEFGELTDRDFLAMGDPKAPRVVKRDPVSEAPDASMTKLAGGEVKTAPGLTPLTFTTEKGSVYEVRGAGTVRNKAQRAEHGADQGVKPLSDRTVYIDMDAANRLATPNSGWRMFAHDDGTFSVIVKNADGKWGIAPSAKNVKVSTTPKKGLVPLEVWKADESVQGFGGVAYKQVHFGNKIVSIGEQAGTGVPDDVAAKGLTRVGDSGGKEVYINFGRMNSPDDVKKTIGQMADAFKGDIDEARRGIQSNEETVRLADDLGMSVADLLNRRKGQGFNAEQAVAARKLWAASAEKLTELAKKAADPNAGAIDQFNFRRMMAMHYAIQAEVIGARTETARALQSWSIPVGGGVERAKAVQMMLDQMGGPQFSKAMAQRLAVLSAENPAAVSQFVRKSWGAATIDVVQEAWVNALLSGPKTHAVNMMSNVAVAFQQVMERGAAERISALRGGEVAPGEQMAMAYGLISSLKDAFRASAKALRTGENPTLPGKIDMPTREPAIQGDWLRESGHNGMAAAVDLIGHTARLPGRFLGAEDAFFKTVGYRAELHAQALRQAHAEGFRGQEMAKRMAEIVNNPPEFMRLSAADAAMYSTFSNATGDIGKAMLQFRDKVPGAFFVMPFVKTPINIARYAFERSPIAPLVGQWRADIAAGGARADLALARMGTGTGIMLVAADMADRGLITGTGPDDQGEKEVWLRQGKKPNSIKVGDKWIAYDRLDPIGMTMGFAASLVELTRRFDIEPEEMDEVNEVIAAGVTAVANTAVNKTYMRGVSQFFEAITEGKTNPEAIQNWMRNFTGSFVPSVAGTAEQIVDPVQRETMKIFDAAQAKLVGLSEKLTPKRDLWGEPITADSPIYDALSPVQVSKIKVSPIDAEMQRLNTNIQRISKRVNWDGVDINLRDWPEVYDAYTELAGNKLKHPAWGLGAKDFLNKMVSGEHELSPIYRMLPDTRRTMDGGKAAFLAKQISDYRALARRDITSDPKFASFAEAIGQGKAAKREKKMPGIGSELRP